LTRCCRGEFAAAVDCGKKTIYLHPYFALGRVHYAQALDLAGRFEEALVEYRLACVMSPDLARLRAEEGRCLARQGRKAEAAAILAELEDRRLTEYVDAYFMAFLYEALDQTDRAFEELERAGAENSTNLFMMDVDPRMDGLRAHPRFTRMRNKFFRSFPAQKVSDFRNGNVVIPTYTPKDSTQRHRAAS